MLDIVVYERATNKEVDRIPTSGMHEANAVLGGIRINMSPAYRATSMPHDHFKSGCKRTACVKGDPK